MFLVLVKELNARYMHKIRFPIPTEMIVVRTTPVLSVEGHGRGAVGRETQLQPGPGSPYPPLTPFHWTGSQE